MSGRDFFGGLLMVIGGLIALFAGGCTLVLGGSQLFQGLQHGGSLGGVSSLPMILLFGGLPFLLGIGLFLGGSKLRGGGLTGPGDDGKERSTVRIIFGWVLILWGGLALLGSVVTGVIMITSHAKIIGWGALLGSVIARLIFGIFLILGGRWLAGMPKWNMPWRK